MPFIIAPAQGFGSPFGSQWWPSVTTTFTKTHFYFEGHFCDNFLWHNLFVTYIFTHFLMHAHIKTSIAYMCIHQFGWHFFVATLMYIYILSLQNYFPRSLLISSAMCSWFHWFQISIHPTSIRPTNIHPTSIHPTSIHPTPIHPTSNIHPSKKGRRRQNQNKSY